MSKDLQKFISRLNLKDTIQKNPKNEDLKKEYREKFGKKEYWFLLRSIYPITKNKGK